MMALLLMAICIDFRDAVPLNMCTLITRHQRSISTENVSGKYAFTFLVLHNRIPSDIWSQACT